LATAPDQRATGAA